MNVLFTSQSPVPVRLTQERDAEQSGLSSYAFGALLLVALVAVPVLSRVLAFVPGL